MGTRHHQVVISKTGERKISQYGQWDGYPDIQGVEILRTLRAVDLRVYQDELSKIDIISSEQIKVVEASVNPQREYPYLYRDCGSDIHLLIPQGRVKFVNHISQKDAEEACDGFYTVDFQTGFFTSLFGEMKKSYALDNLPSDEVYLSETEPPEEE